MDREALTHALGSAADARAACRVVVSQLATRDLLPSAFLARGDRLRLQAAAGYWQVFDGLPPGAGVVGATFASGRAHVVQDVRREPRYLAAVSGIVAEACFPLREGARTIGVLNVERHRPLAEADVIASAECAKLLSDRIAALGGVPAETVAQRLLRHATTLASLVEIDTIERELVAAALDVGPLESGLVLRRGSGPDGEARVAPREPTGPLALLLGGASQPALRTIAAMTASGASAFTPGSGEHSGTGMASLRAAGATALAALPVGPDRVLVLASDRAAVLSTEELERLELLAAQAAACLRTAHDVGRLREQAATDPLTGLGHHAAFTEALAEHRDACGLGVLIVDVDGFKRWNDRHGHQAGDRVLRETAGALAGALRRGDRLFRIGGDEFAALLRAGSESEALEAARRLHQAVAFSGAGVSVSVGVAVGERGERPEVVQARADVALYDVKRSGRDGVCLAPPAAAAAV